MPDGYWNRLKSRDPNDDDFAAFAEAVRDVKPLPPHNLADTRSPVSHPAEKPTATETSKTIHDDDGCVAKSGIQRSVLRKIRNGQIPVEDELDLHGLTVQQSEEKLRAFLHNSRTDRQRLVRIIHGKGHRSANQEAVLRIKVNEWLSQSEYVLAFCPAGPSDGGTGAVRVLLKRR